MPISKWSIKGKPERCPAEVRPLTQSQATGIFSIAATVAVARYCENIVGRAQDSQQAGNLWPYAFACFLTAVDIAIGLWWCTEPDFGFVSFRWSAWRLIATAGDFLPSICRGSHVHLADLRLYLAECGRQRGFGTLLRS